jgi:hypothetical protein
MPMKPKLTVALSEFSKGRWAAEPSDEPPLHSTELNLVTRLRLWLGKLSPLAFARYLRQSVDKLASEITKVQAVEQDILNQISTALSRPAATLPRNAMPRSPQARP